jgi:hypothetical protein
LNIGVLDREADLLGERLAGDGLERRGIGQELVGRVVQTHQLLEVELDLPELRLLRRRGVGLGDPVRLDATPAGAVRAAGLVDPC